MRPVTMPALPLRAVAHGILFSSWVVLFVVQTVLVAAGHTKLHRRLGIAASVVVVVMVASAPLMAISLARQGFPRGDPLGFMFVILMDVFFFGMFAAVAVSKRRRSEIHKRLMLLAMASLLPPAIARLPIAVRNPVPVVMGVMLFFVAAPPVYDLLTRHRPHPVSLWGGLVLFASLPLRVMFSQTAAWHHVASWLVR